MSGGEHYRRRGPMATRRGERRRRPWWAVAWWWLGAPVITVIRGAWWVLRALPEADRMIEEIAARLATRPPRDRW